MHITELINEAISVTQHESAFDAAIRTSINSSVGYLYTLKGTYTDQEKEFDDPDTGSWRPLMTALSKNLYRALKHRLPNAIRVSINTEMGDKVVDTVTFDDLGERTRGEAQADSITLNSRYLNSLTKHLLTAIFDSVSSSYNENERVDGLFFTFKMFDQKDRYTLNLFDNSMTKTIENIVSTITHEVVHVIQYNQQVSKGRDDIEYRSYLDKTKGEFRNIIDNPPGANEPPRSPEEQERQWNLYLASPQEIAAFAHQAALEVIRDHGINQATSPEELDPKQLSAGSIIYAVDKVSAGRFSKPKTPKEQMVRNRYLKLAYQEIVRTLEHKLASLKKQS